MNAIVTRENIYRLQEELLKYPQVEFPTEHSFADGMYARKMLIRKGVVMVGKVHKKEHFAFLMTGEITVTMGSTIQRIKAPFMVVTPPGSKRAVYAHEDSWCLTIHRTDLTDIAAIEDEIAEPEPNSAYLPGNILKCKVLHEEPK